MIDWYAFLSLLWRPHDIAQTVSSTVLWESAIIIAVAALLFSFVKAGLRDVAHPVARAVVRWSYCVIGVVLAAAYTYVTTLVVGAQASYMQHLIAWSYVTVTSFFLVVALIVSLFLLIIAFVLVLLPILLMFPSSRIADFLVKAVATIAVVLYVLFALAWTGYFFTGIIQGVSGVTFFSALMIVLIGVFIMIMVGAWRSRRRSKSPLVEPEEPVIPSIKARKKNVKKSTGRSKEAKKPVKKTAKKSVSRKKKKATKKKSRKSTRK
ncbi:hypothetical protein GF342_00135 [Candidatus Woesearchaeota archaeon]|nr:hypothetical protein [Candidatus Woesearchaeota archaeon]